MLRVAGPGRLVAQVARLAAGVGRCVPLPALVLSKIHEEHAQRRRRGVAFGSIEGAPCACSCWRFCGGCDFGVFGAALPACFLDLNDEAAAAASGAGVRGAGYATASRADSFPSTTEMMSLIDFEAMDGSLRTLRQISTL